MKKLYLSILVFCLTINNLFGVDIIGSVFTEDGKPLPGANIYFLNTNKGAVSNSDGKFIIKDILTGKYVVVVSYLGYKSETKEYFVQDSIPSFLEFVLRQSAVGLDEVIVTSNKREENIMDIPVTISAISNESFNDFNVRQRTDLTALVPNTLVSESGSHLTSLINIRGMFPSNFFTATTLLFYEGVPIFGYGQNPMYLNDIERIEVLRGPQGTIYGRNSLAGVINLVAKKPNNKSSYLLGLNYGNYNNLNVNFGISQPVIDGKLLTRFAGYYYKKDGFYRNTYLNTDVGGSSGFGGSLSLRYFPEEHFSAEYFGNIEYIDESAFCLAVNVDSALKNRFEIQRNFDSYVKKYNSINSLKLSYFWDKVKFVSTTAFQSIFGYDWKNDADFTEKDLIGYSDESPETTLSQEFRIESRNEESGIRWLGGLFYLYNDKDVDYYAILNGNKSQINQGIKPIGLQIDKLEQHTVGKDYLNNIAVFGNVNIGITDFLEITVGLRYEKEQNRIDRRTYFDYNGTLPNPVPDALKATLGFLNSSDTSRYEINSEFLSHKYAMIFNLPHGNLYANITRGYHGGGFNTGNNKKVPYYDNENTWNYEFGYKGLFFNNRLRTNICVFHIDWLNQQLLVVGDLSTPFQTISNAGKSAISGFELELEGIVAEGLSFNFSFGYLDAKITDYRFSDKINGRDTVIDYSGNKIPFSPDFNSNLIIKYEFPFKLFDYQSNWASNISFKFIDSYYSSHVNLFKTDPRLLVNLKTGINFENYELAFWINNIFDLYYVYGTYEYRGGQNAVFGSPRTFGLNFNVFY